MLFFAFFFGVCAVLVFYWAGNKKCFNLFLFFDFFDFFDFKFNFFDFKINFFKIKNPKIQK